MKIADKEFTIIRQPYRITMAKWNFNVVHSRILTKIIDVLQPQIDESYNGKELHQLDLFSNANNSIYATLPFKEVSKSNNNKEVLKALKDMKRDDIEMVLPVIVGKKSKKPAEAVVITTLIKDIIYVKNSRTVTVELNRALAEELVRAKNGLTSFAKEVIYISNNQYTHRYYQFICHWKDRECIKITPEKFHDAMNLSSGYKLPGTMISRIIKPAQEELKAVSDIYSEFDVEKKGQKIEYFLIYPKQKKKVLEDLANFEKERDYNYYLLRTYFNLQPEHLKVLSPVLNDKSLVRAIKEKIMYLEGFIFESRKSPEPIKDQAAYIVECLNSEFSKSVTVQ